MRIILEIEGRVSGCPVVADEAAWNGVFLFSGCLWFYL